MGHPWVAGLLWSPIGYETMNMDFIYLRKSFLSWDDHRPLIPCFDPHMERWGNTKAFKSYMAHQYQSISIQFDWYFTITGWWFGTCFIFHNIWDNPSYWLIFFRGVETTNQIILLNLSFCNGAQKLLCLAISSEVKTWHIQKLENISLNGDMICHLRCT